MAAVSFQVSGNLLLSLANVCRNGLAVTSTRESQDRWENLQECLRLAAAVAPEWEDKVSLARLALVV